MIDETRWVITDSEGRDMLEFTASKLDALGMLSFVKIATPYTNKGIELKEKSWPARKN